MQKCLANRYPALSIIQYSRARYSEKPTGSEVKGGSPVVSHPSHLLKYLHTGTFKWDRVNCLIPFSHISNFDEFIKPQVKQVSHSFSLLRTPVHQPLERQYHEPISLFHILTCSFLSILPPFLFLFRPASCRDSQVGSWYRPACCRDSPVSCWYRPAYSRDSPVGSWYRPACCRYRLALLLRILNSP